MTAEQALKRWLISTTCSNESRLDCVWQSDCGRFVIFRHGSHASYVDRMTGSVNCEAYQHLIDLENLISPNREGNYLPIKEWTGRWSQSKIGYAKDLIKEILK